MIIMVTNTVMNGMYLVVMTEVVLIKPLAARGIKNAYGHCRRISGDSWMFRLNQV